jgi:y4mF family transcriptional regulator
MNRANDGPMRSPEQAALAESVCEIGPDQLPHAVRFHRKKSGLSQAELATFASVGKTVIFDIEKGKRTVRLDTLLKVLSILNIKMLFHSPLMEIYLRNPHEKSRRLRARYPGGGTAGNR